MNKKGVFWIVDGILLAFPFDETATEGIAKSGDTFNHKLLWEHVKPCNKPFDYYPRGRVDCNSKGAAIIYMNPNIDDMHIPFRLRYCFYKAYRLTDGSIIQK